ncbi:oligosaccharide flippase family protein [Mycolicibacterium phlei]
MYTVSQAVLLVLLARDVGPHGFGVIASFLAAHTVLFWLASMNTPTFVTREIALDQPDRAFASIRLNAWLLNGSIVLALLSSMLLLDQPLLLLAVAANAFAIGSERMTENRLAIAYGQRRVGPPVMTLAVRSAIPLVLYLGMLAFGINPLVAFSCARVVAGVVSQIISIVLIRIPRSRAASQAREIIRAQLPLAMSQSMSAIRMLDSVVVIALAGATVSGIYSAVSRVVSPFNTIAISAAPVLVPRAVEATPARLRKWVDGLMLMGLGGSIATLAIYPFRENIVVLVFGSEFVGGGAVLVWVLLRVGAAVASPLMSNVLQARGFDRLAAINSTVTSILTLASVAVGSVVWGAPGAAAGFALVSLLGMLLLWGIGRMALRDKTEVRSA